MRALLCSLLLLVAFPLSAADPKTIQLEDGSSLRGEVVSLQNGVYTIRTQSLGLIMLNAARVTSINGISAANTSKPAKSRSTGSETIEFDAIRALMMSNVDIMTSILDLHNDPELKAVLSDADIMRAVQNFDIEALTNNPKFRQLMDHPKIRQIQKQVRK